MIGSRYAPWHYERRTPLEYSALRPAIAGDALRIQSALLATRERAGINPERVVGAASAVVAAVLVALLSTGVIV